MVDFEQSVANFLDLKSHSFLSLPSNELGDVHQMTVLKMSQAVLLILSQVGFEKGVSKQGADVICQSYTQADLWLSKAERRNTPALSATLRVASGGSPGRLMLVEL